MPRPPALLDSPERHAPRALVEHALKLVGRIHRGSPDNAQAAEVELQQWRQATPDKAEAVATAQRIWNATDADDLRGRWPLPPTAAQERLGRRRIVGMLGVASFLARAGAGGRWYWLRPLDAIALRTERAQTLAQRLPDGSNLDLAPNTAVQVTLYRHQRIVRLARGEARFDIAPDAQRPFIVETDWGRVRVLGTVFTVSARNGHMRVAVAHGHVAVWPATAQGSAIDVDAAPAAQLRAGDAIEANAHGLGEPSRVDVADVAGWKQGWLVLRNTRLPEAIARWNDYLRQPLRLVDEASLRDLRVTGSYQLRDPQAFLDSLPTMLPVRVTRTAGDGAEISARR